MITENNDGVVFLLWSYDFTVTVTEFSLVGEWGNLYPQSQSHPVTLGEVTVNIPLKGSQVTEGYQYVFSIFPLVFALGLCI